MTDTVNGNYTKKETQTAKAWLDGYPKTKGDFGDLDSERGCLLLLELETGRGGKQRPYVVLIVHARYLKHFRWEDRQYWWDRCTRVLQTKGRRPHAA